MTDHSRLPHAPVRETEPPRGNKETILVAEDDPDLLALLCIVLEDHGYHAVRAISGTLAVILARAAPPALLLLDVMLPGMDGFAVCTALQQSAETRRVPVIFLTALSSTADRVRGLTCAGARDYIVKPFDSDELLARIHVALHPLPTLKKEAP